MAHGGQNKKCSDEEFVRLFNQHGATETSRILETSERGVYARRASLAKFFSITAPTKVPNKEYPHRAQLEVKNGCIIVGSDFHIWPGAESTALRAFKKLCNELKPAAVILNGDVLDFPKISRHPPIGWEKTPTPVEEIEAAQDHLNDIVQAVPRGCRKIWTLGNHDARFETRLATVASEYKGLKGIHLSDHFPIWEKGWSVHINAGKDLGHTVCKHRFKGGQGAVRANVLNAGVSMFTAHLHCPMVIPYTDYRGTRYGIDTGMVAETDGKQFVDYTEDAPLNWRSSFGIATYDNYRLMYPELVSVWDDKTVQFRGDLIRC